MHSVYCTVVITVVFLAAFAVEFCPLASCRRWQLICFLLFICRDPFILVTLKMIISYLNLTVPSTVILTDKFNHYELPIFEFHFFFLNSQGNDVNETSTLCINNCSKEDKQNHRSFMGSSLSCKEHWK